MFSSSPHILNTRPTGQHHAFSHKLQALGFTVSHLPCLSIASLPGTPLQDDPQVRFDIVLFTSANAVNFAHAQRPLPWDGVAIHAIGAATARALQTLNQPLALIPQAPFNSEAYLAQLSHHLPARLLLIKGQGGRDLISSQLRTSGWQVSEMDLYRREIPSKNMHLIATILDKKPLDLISVTSNESLDNLVILTGQHLPGVLQLPLVVNSQRAIEKAKLFGFSKDPIVACPPGDEGQITAIQQFFRLHS
ncbi:uroporphyrinogen-III synthase [Granulosicoccus antarcticus]|uniref:Uroporphyrinogen-III synthase n=1 Tax=Granulosicoccus antarcticus IMCC3135 TaxID=1192854 RepID=A0A2Z2NMP3_9GAMM|nr:uroporphyrinogen-III synthase [Granulosicoccus antarcticus]ASJ70140.1 Uroporphyrinogen-III synthase [Granulosicoccus antarcticus IMCC3135]